MAIYGTSFSKFKRLETVVNGTFDTDTDWTKETGWTISSNKAHWDGDPLALLKSTETFVIGRIYTVTFTVSNYTGTGAIGLVNQQFETPAIGYVSGDGVHVVTGVMALTQLWFYGRDTNTYSLDDVTTVAEIDLNYNIIKPSWKIPQVIEHQSILTGGINYIQVAGDKASFDVICNIWKNAVPKTTMQTILSHNHTLVNFMPHEDSGEYLTTDSVIVADFYISIMKPFYVRNRPPILQDKLFIRFESLGSIFMPEVVPPFLVDEEGDFLVDEEGDKLIKEL